MEVTLKEYVTEYNEQEKVTNMQIIKPVGIGKNATNMIELEDGTIGFYKNSALTTNGMLDELEYFISIVGSHILGFDLARVFKVYSDGEPIGIISKNVVEPSEKLMMFSDITDVLMENPTGDLLKIASDINEMKSRTQQTFVTPDGNQKTFPVLTEDEDIIKVVDTFLIALDKLNVPQQDKAAMTKKYFEMIVLDSLTGQKDRNNTNYGIIYNQETKKTTFASLFDNSTIYIPGIPDDFCQLNGCLIDNSKLMNVLVTHYEEHSLDIINPIVENKDDIISRAKSVSYIIMPNHATWIMSIFERNINTLSTISKKNVDSK